MQLFRKLKLLSNRKRINDITAKEESYSTLWEFKIGHSTPSASLNLFWVEKMKFEWGIPPWPINTVRRRNILKSGICISCLKRATSLQTPSSSYPLATDQVMSDSAHSLTQVHEGHGEVNHLLPLLRYGQVTNREVCPLEQQTPITTLSPCTHINTKSQFGDT